VWFFDTSPASAGLFYSCGLKAGDAPVWHFEKVVQGKKLYALHVSSRNERLCRLLTQG
jgi:hypothetical protein